MIVPAVSSVVKLVGRAAWTDVDRLILDTVLVIARASERYDLFLLFAPWEFFFAFRCLLFFSQYQHFKKNSFRNMISVKQFDPDQARHSFGPDLGPNYLQKISTDDTRR